MIKVNIGIPTYNGAERLSWLLESLAIRTPHLQSGEAEIAIVDDGSPRRQETRDTVARFSERMPIRFLEHDGNRGISAGWNTVTRVVDAPINVLINDDVIVADGWLDSLVHVLEHSPGVGVVGQNWHAFLPEDAPKLLKSIGSDRDVIPRDPVSKAQMPNRREDEDTWPGRVMVPTGQLFAFRREDFDAIGGFDEGYKSFFEESCFGTSMAAQLKKIGVQTTWPFNYHLWSATFGQNAELQPSERMEGSRDRYRRKWEIPDRFTRGSEFDFTNPTHLGVIEDVEIGFLRKDGPWRGVLRTDGAFVDGRRV